MSLAQPENLPTYRHADSSLGAHHAYLLPTIDRVLGAAAGRAVFEIGFGNGSVCDHLARNGFAVAGIEPSSEGVHQARAHYPALAGLRQGSVYDDLAALHGGFDVVLSLEVIEHLYAPRKLAAAAFALLKPGGILILSTPYHGYLKNLALSLAGRWDHHMDPLWDHGHIKLWSPVTLRALLDEAGFSRIAIHRVGRFPPLAKSMIAEAHKAAAPTPSTAIAHS